MNIDNKIVIGKTFDNRPIYQAKNISGMSRWDSKVNLNYNCGNCNAYNERKKEEMREEYIFKCNECNVLNQLNLHWEKVYKNYEY